MVAHLVVCHSQHSQYDVVMFRVPPSEDLLPVTDHIRTTTGEGTEVADSVKELNKSEDRGEQTADNIRYGQNISESGMGGMTEGNSGSASTGG